MKLIYTPWIDGVGQDFMIHVVQEGRNVIRKKISDPIERNRAVKLLDALCDPVSWTVTMQLRTDRPVNESFRNQFKDSPGYNNPQMDDLDAKYPGCFHPAIKTITEKFENQAVIDAQVFNRILTPTILNMSYPLALSNAEPDESLF